MTDDSALDTLPFDALVSTIRACRVCEAELPLGPRPILHVAPEARLLIASQAPGTKVHETGQSFNDASGDRLREWLGIDRATFYDTSRIALIPMGFCYPGRLPRGGDRPPRPECAKLWRKPLLEKMPNIRLTLLVGSYAQNYVLGPGKMDDRVRDFEAYLPEFFPLPHPSWRTSGWERRSPWFRERALPALREAVQRVISD